MEEIWKPIEGYEGLYEVSSYGRVKRLGGYDRFNRKKVSKILKLSYNNSGYYIVHLWKNGFRKSKLLHRLVAETFIPNIDNLPQVNHKDENKSNNRVDNLEWCTAKYNSNYGTSIERRKVKMINNGYFLDLNSDEKKIYKKEYHKKYYQENKEYISEHKKRYYQEHKEYIKEYYKRYYQEHKRG